MNRSQEEYIFKAFKELYTDFPEGKYIRGEQPDYIIHTSGKTIGVEITQIFIDSYTDSSSNEKRKESLHSMVGHTLCQKLIPIVPFKFLLSIDYSKNNFSKFDINIITSACEIYFKQIQFSIQDYTPIDINNFGQLPKEIDSINLFRYPSLKDSSFVESAGGITPNLTSQHLQAILDKKDKSLKKYKPCNEHWLLIEEGTFYADSFDDIVVDQIKTDFKKIFLYRHSKKEIIELK